MKKAMYHLPNTSELHNTLDKEVAYVSSILVRV